MTARTNTSSGPKADGSHPVAYAILSGLAVGLFLPVIGLLLDSPNPPPAKMAFAWMAVSIVYFAVVIWIGITLFSLFHTSTRVNS